jgi:hypothetical protein
MAQGSLNIGDLVLQRLRTLDVSCPQCGRGGQLNVAKLQRDYGTDFRLPDLAHALAKDCDNPPPYLNAQCPVKFRG